MQHAYQHLDELIYLPVTYHHPIIIMIMLYCLVEQNATLGTITIKITIKSEL